MDRDLANYDQPFKTECAINNKHGY